MGWATRRGTRRLTPLNLQVGTLLGEACREDHPAVKLPPLLQAQLHARP